LKSPVKLNQLTLGPGERVEVIVDFYKYEKVRIIIKFTHVGTFMYHCHILEHEDQGMMGQFQVTDN